MAVTILLADDHRIFRDGLRPLLEAQDDLEVVAEAETGPDALEAARTHRPDVAVLDISMPGMTGLEVARRLAVDAPSVRVVFLSMHSDRRYVVEALRSGARGYLLKDAGFDELLAAVRAVAEDHVYLGHTVREQVIRDYIHIADVEESPVLAALSTREREVLKLLAEGLGTKQIAERLAISAKTVETHRKGVMDKLEIRSVAELTRLAIREGLTPLD